MKVLVQLFRKCFLRIYESNSCCQIFVSLFCGKLIKSSFLIHDVFQLCPRDLPLCVHAEGHTMGSAILLAEMFDRHVHICHVSTKDEIEIIKLAKSRNLKVRIIIT